MYLLSGVFQTLESILKNLSQQTTELLKLLKRIGMDSDLQSGERSTVGDASLARIVPHTCNSDPFCCTWRQRESLGYDGAETRTFRDSVWIVFDCMICIYFEMLFVCIWSGDHFLRSAAATTFFRVLMPTQSHLVDLLVAFGRCIGEPL